MPLPPNTVITQRGKGHFRATIDNKLISRVDLCIRTMKVGFFWTKKDYRKQGVMTSMYEYIETTLGKPIVPNPVSETAKAFRIAYDKTEAGKKSQAAAQPVVTQNTPEKPPVVTGPGVTKLL